MAVFDSLNMRLSAFWADSKVLTSDLYMQINKALWFRTFLPKSLISHQKMCTPDNPMTKQLKEKSYTGQVSYKYFELS